MTPRHVNPGSKRARPLRMAAVAGAAALVFAACGSDDSTAPVDTAAAETGDDAADAAAGNIVEVASAAGDFTTLVAAVQAAGLVETLSEGGPFTVFAPTDEAFAAALDALGLTPEELLADTDTLTSILTYHVVEGAVPSSDVVTLDGEMVPTLNGASVTISVDGDTVMVDSATVTAVDVEAWLRRRGGRGRRCRSTGGAACSSHAPRSGGCARG
jgi:transforming growth factor-beta-induced protein